MKYRSRLGDTTLLVNTAVKPPAIKGPSALRGELSGGIRLNTDGYGLFVDKGWIRDNDKYGKPNKDKLFSVNMLQVELLEHKNAKEVGSSNASGGANISTSSYILGKINNFYSFKVGVGRRQLIAGKPDPGTFSLHWVNVGGFAAGLLKPYYLNIYGLGTVKYSDSIAEDFVSPGMIESKAGFGTGLGETKFIPGIHLKSGLHVDFASGRKSLMAIEAGVNGEYYFGKIQQMVLQDPKSLFLNFYASIQFGGRW
ncbi:MAG: hypothetical protein QM642_05305 [Edaphocola sp.]